MTRRTTRLLQFPRNNSLHQQEQSKKVYVSTGGGLKEQLIIILFLPQYRYLFPRRDRRIRITYGERYVLHE